jgi:hypothetical protein
VGGARGTIADVLDTFLILFRISYIMSELRTRFSF